MLLPVCDSSSRLSVNRTSVAQSHLFFFFYFSLSLPPLFFLFKRMPFLSSTGSWLGSKTNRVFAESSQDQLGASQCSALFCLLLRLGPSSSSSNSSSVAQSCPALCNPMNHGTPDLPVHHQLPEFTQTHIHPAISSSVVPFSSCPQSLPASELDVNIIVIGVYGGGWVER